MVDRRRREPASIPTPIEPTAFRRDRRTWAAYLLLGLFAYLETILGPAMPFVRAHLGLGYGVASLHFSAFAAGAITIGLTGERWLRRLGRERALWGGIAGMIAGALLIAFSPSVVGTIGGALIMGMIGTVSLVANQAVLSDLHGDQRTVALMESNVVATAMAIMAPLVIGGLAGEGWGWQSGIVITAPWLGALWLAFGGARFPAAAPVTRHHTEQHRLPTVFWILCLVLFLVSAIEWCMAYWGADFLASVVGLERAAAATAMTLFFVAMTGGRLVGSRLARRYRSVALLLAALLIALGGFLLYWLAPQPVSSLAGLFIAGLGIANFYPLTVAIAIGVTPHQVDRAAGRLAVASGAAMLTLPLAVGIVSDVVGMRWGFGIVAILLAAAMATVGVSMRWFLAGGRRSDAMIAGPSNAL